MAKAVEVIKYKCCECSVLLDFVKKYSADNYSESEVNTGAKWIDGSDIYKITIKAKTAAAPQTYNTMAEIADFKELVRLPDGYIYVSGTFVPFGYCNANWTDGIDVTVTAGGLVNETHYTANYSNRDLTATIYYTKK